MRINSNTPGASEVSAERTSTAPASTPNPSRTPEADKFGGDTVSLSSLAAQTLQMPAVRQEKVDALRHKIESGAYEIDPRKTADAMLNE
jgi:negative regulator of flagellin synthesis FlgM